MIASPAPPQRDDPPAAAPVDRPRRLIENRTARRISVSLGADTRVTIPPLGTAEVQLGAAERDALRPWLERNLVRVVQATPRGAEVSEASAGVALLLLMFSVTLAVLLRLRVIELGRAYLVTLGALCGVVVVVSLLSGASAARLGARRAWRGVARYVGVGAVAFVAFVVPVLLVWAQVLRIDGKDWLKGPQLPLFLVYAGLLIGFVGLVSMLPALLYFLFDEEKADTGRRAFFLEVMRLDPAVLTVDDAEAVYGELASEAVGGRRPGRLSGMTGVPVLISTLLMSLGWTATLLPALERVLRPGKEDGIQIAALFTPDRGIFCFAFLGAYFFALQLVFRRYVRSDLGPKAYTHVSLRIIIAVVLAWVAAAIPALPGDAETVAALLAVSAFFIGIVPETGLALIHDFARKRGGMIGRAFPSLHEPDPLSDLEGITLYDRARLLEEGIENVENLAHHDLVQLLARTRIPAPRLVDLVDQAILYLHARDAGEDRPSARDILRSLGIRTATDLEGAAAALAPGERAALMSALGAVAGVPRVQVMLSALRDDEWMVQLRHWRDYRTICARVFSLESFTPEAPRDRPPPDPHVQHAA